MKNLPYLLFFAFLPAFGQDLYVTQVTGPKTYQQYEALNVTVTLKNEGTVAINKRNYINVYLSPDNALGNDLYIGFIDFNALGANQSVAVTCMYCNSITSPPGNYYLILEVDRGEAIAETNETNNIHVVSGYTVTTPDVDFVVSQMSFDKTSVMQHDIIKPTYEVRNLGTTDASGSLFTTFYLSTDQILSDNDIDLAYYWNSLDGPDVVHNADWNEIIIPSVTTGTYYIIARTDDIYRHSVYFDETNELNNIAVSGPITINGVAAALEVLEPMSAMYYDGSIPSIFVNYQLKNNGTSGISGYLIEYYLVSVETGSSQRIYSRVADHTSAYVAPNSTNYSADHISFYPPTIPPAGDFKVEVRINMNTAIPESDLSDNTLQSNTITIPQFPDPVITITEASFPEAYTDRDLIINLQTTFKNEGERDMFFVDQLYIVSVKNESQSVFDDIHMGMFYLNVDESEVITWELELNQSLAAGEYTVEIKCAAGPCYTNTYTLPLTILPTPSITITTAAFNDSYDSHDTDFELAVNFLNSGSGPAVSLQQDFTLLIRDSENVFGGNIKSETFDLVVNEAKEVNWSIPLAQPLQPGIYQAEISWTDPYGATASFAIAFNIEAAIEPEVTLTSAIFNESHTDVDTQLNLTVNFSNTGTVDVESLDLNFDVTISGAFAAEKTATLNIPVSGSTETAWELNLTNPLEPGDYTVTIACSTGPCYTSTYSFALHVEEAFFSLVAEVQGEDGNPITNGSLFLYKKKEAGLEFVEQKDLASSTTDFTINNDAYTLYFIPSAVDFPEYVPTLYNNALFLNENSFFSTTENKTLTFKAVKLTPSQIGNRFIEGNVFEEGSAGGRVKDVLPVENLPLILLNSSFNAIAHTRTHSQGDYEFRNLQPGTYWILIAFEPDHEFSYSMPEVNLSEQNASVKLNVSNGMLEKEITGIPDAVVTDLPETEAIFIQAFPNPFQGLLIIDNKSCYTSVAIYDFAGRSIKNLSIDCGRNELNTTSFASGVYILKFTGENGRSILKKLIKL